MVDSGDREIEEFDVCPDGINVTVAEFSPRHRSSQTRSCGIFQHFPYESFQQYRKILWNI